MNITLYLANTISSNLEHVTKLCWLQR